MKLSRQLFLVSLLTLTLPWAGCQYVRQLDAQLLDAQALALLDRAESIAVQLQTNPDLFADLLPPPELGAINFLNLQSRPVLDGECGDWLEPSGDLISNWQELDPGVSYLAGRNAADFYLCVQVDDPQVQYHRPNLGSLVFGDHLVLHTGTERYWLRTTAEGAFQGVYLSESGDEILDYTINAYWAEQSEGYLVEFRVPDFVARNALAFEVVENGNQTLASVGIGLDGEPLRYLQTNDNLQVLIEAFAQADPQESIYLLTNSGTVAASSSSKNTDFTEIPEDWLATLYELVSSQNFVGDLSHANEQGFFNTQVIDALLADSKAEVVWHRNENLRVARAYYPLDISGLRVATLILDEPARTMSDINSAALTRLLWYTGLAFAITSFGLIAYALLLSARIRRLSRATSELVRGRQGDSSTKPIFVPSKAKDELGELNRQYGEMLSRVGGYTNYLQSLSGKLSHEIRTPVAIVSSSLDNLEHAEGEIDRAKYIDRAREGIDRLSNILSTMSQSTAVESAIENAEREVFEPTAVLKDLVAAYAELYPGISISLNIAEGAAQVSLEGSADLFAQMLDKLVDNAADFCESEIRIRLDLLPKNLCLRVANDGAALPDDMAENLFDSLVSVRSEKSEKPHLGLGLFVVKRVVDFHLGTVKARNLDDGQGVEFVVELPLPVAQI